MELEEAIKELRVIFKETDFEDSKRRIAIEIVLQRLENLEEAFQIVMQRLENSIPKKKIEEERWRCIKEAGSYDISNATINQHKLIGGYEILNKLLEDK